MGHTKGPFASIYLSASGPVKRKRNKRKSKKKMVRDSGTIWKKKTGESRNYYALEHSGRRRAEGFLNARPGVKKFRSIWICFKMWILFQQAAGWLPPATLLHASARGLPAVYIYPVLSCTDPPRFLPAVPPLKLAASYTTFARALFVHIFASLFCVFRHSPRTVYLSSTLYKHSFLSYSHIHTEHTLFRVISFILSRSWFYSLQYLGEKYVLWIQDPCYCTLCFMFNLIFLIFPGFLFFFSFFSASTSCTFFFHLYL